MAVIVDASLALAVLIEVICALGIVLMKTPLQRLHFVGPATTVAPALVAIAVAMAKHPYSGSGFKAGFIALALIVFSPILSHETARAAVSREGGRLP